MPISKQQRKLANIIREIFGCNVVDNFKGFDWLRTDLGRKQEIDIWVPGIKLAIKDMHIFASTKGGKCLSIGYIGNKHKLIWKCEYGHVWRANYANIGQGKCY